MSGPAMPSLTVIKYFNIFCNHPNSFGIGTELSALNQFRF